jgi:hypothetical protein
VKFYGLRHTGAPYRTRYSRLCGLLGTKRQRYLSDAKCILGPAHQELQEGRFLAKVEWYKVTGEKGDWLLHYWPGDRAKAEWRQDYWRRIPEVGEPVFVEEPPETEDVLVYVEEPLVDESSITVEVITDQAPEMPLARVEVIEEEPQSSSPEGAYAAMALEAFERATGKFRKLARLSEAERRRLQQWHELGVTDSDITEGTKEALKKQVERARESGKPAREILSLAYIRGYVLDAAAKRQQLEALQRSSLEKARASQSPELRATEEALKKQLREPIGESFYRKFFQEAVLVEGGDGWLVLLTPVEAFVPMLKAWKGVVEQFLGRAVFFAWSVEWVHGQDWRKQL